MEKRVEIDVLYGQGKGICEIARATALARNTVREIIRGRHDGRYGPRPQRRRKLDDHAVYLRERLERASDHRLHATVLLRELRERGYDGGLTQLKDFLRVERPVAPPEPVIRFETPPGQQLQIDQRKANPDATVPLPMDLVTSSARGIDPDISPEAAFYQAPRIAKLRGLRIDDVDALIADRIQGRELGFLGEPHINVLDLNLALDRIRH